MMETTIKYIPLADKRVHYVESGARPEIRETEFSVNVIVQDGNAIFPANYTPDNDRFATLYADNTVRPICWWHLPDPVPVTEREWFEKNMRRVRYAIDRWEVDGEYRYRVLSEPIPELHLYETKEAAISAAYAHWVAAGRP